MNIEAPYEVEHRRLPTPVKFACLITLLLVLVRFPSQSLETGAQALPLGKLKK